MRRRQTATHPRRYSVGLGVTAGLELLSDSVDGHRARFGVEIEPARVCHHFTVGGDGYR